MRTIAECPGPDPRASSRTPGSKHPERDGRIVQTFLRSVPLEALASRREKRPSPETVRSDLLRSLVGNDR